MPVPRLLRSRQIQADLSLLLVTVIWGTSFVLVKDVTRAIPPLTFIAERFSLAFVALLLLFGYRLRRSTRAEWRGGALIGALPLLALLGGIVGYAVFRTTGWLGATIGVVVGVLIGALLYLGFLTQTLGLQTSPASVVGFITGLSTVITPVLAFLILRYRPGRMVMAGVALATVGMGLLAFRDGLQLTPGDSLALLCAFFFALQIVAVARYAPHHDVINLSVIQVGVVAALAWPLALALEQPRFDAPLEAWLIVAYLGLAATGLVYFIQTVAQRFTSPVHTALIFTMEPVFAAFFAWLWLGELITGQALLGAALILAGMLAAELRRA